MAKLSDVYTPAPTGNYLSRDEKAQLADSGEPFMIVDASEQNSRFGPVYEYEITGGWDGSVRLSLSATYKKDGADEPLQSRADEYHAIKGAIMGPVDNNGKHVGGEPVGPVRLATKRTKNGNDFYSFEDAE